MGAYATSITYHPSGAIAGFQYGNGIVHSLTQHPRGLPWVSADTGVLNDTYNYDQNGNVSSIVDNLAGTSRTMGYDGLDRLKSVTAALWGTATYDYDSLDNLTANTITGGNTARSVAFNYPDPATNRLMSVSGSAGYNFPYAYDAQGNIIQRDGKQYTFDQGNRMTSAPGVATYGYDGLGHRISVVGTDGINRIQVYSQGGQMLQAGPAGAAARYIYLHNHVIAEVGPAGTQYQHTDALGSPVARTNAGGALVSATKYEPYGKTAQGATPTLGFTGHVNDADTGLVYMQQRYYDPVAGRFLSIDPVTTDANTGGSFNHYAYANNNPYKYIDPDGRNGLIVRFGGPFVLAAAIDVGAQMYGPENRSAGNVNWTAAALSGAGAAITGNVGGVAAKAALQGAISPTVALALTAATGSTTGALTSIVGNLVEGKSIDVKAATFAAAGGGIGAGIGAKLDNAAAALIGKMQAAGGVLGAIASTTQSATNFGSISTVQVGTSTGQEVGKIAVDAATAGAQKVVEDNTK